MQRSKSTLFNRHDTILGVCEGLGQDFGFNANYVRMLLAVALLLSPVGTVAAYLGLGIVIAVSRWIFPSRDAVAQITVSRPADPAISPQSDNDEHMLELAAAA